MLTTAKEADHITCPRWKGSTTDTYPYCSASKCMAWRWHDAEVEIAVTDKNEPPDDFGGWAPRGKNLGAKGKFSWGRPFGERRRGYCGLAGVPKEWNTSVVPAERDDG